MRGAMIAAAAALFLAACGGGTDTEQPEPAAAAASADQQVQVQGAQEGDATETAGAEQADASAARQDEQQAGSDSDGGSATAARPTPLQPATAEELAANPRLELLADAGYPVYLAGEWTISLGTPDLGVGSQRVTIAVEGAEGLYQEPLLGMTANPPADAGADATEVRTEGRFLQFPDGVRGFHAATITFDRAGEWSLELDLPGGAVIALPVAAEPSSPDVGDAAPASVNRTLGDVESVADLSTGFEPDALLYQLTVAEALENGLPTVLVFASPGFCTNAFCGPQAEVLTELRIANPGAANYIHVDLYENPQEVRVGEAPQRTPVLEEWGLHTDEWTFVIAADGTIAARFEAFAPYEEVEAALAAVRS